MTGATITIDDEALRAALQRLAARGENMQPVYERIGGQMLQLTAEHFAQGRGPGGVAWRPSLRAQRQGGAGTLIGRGRLRDSITQLATDAGVAWGTNVAYAGVHQVGARITAKNAKALRFNIPGVGWVMKKAVTIPARPFIGFDDVARREAEAIVVDELKRTTEGSAPGAGR